MGYSFFLSRIFDVEVRSEIGSGEVVEKVQALPRSVDIPLVFIGDDVSPGLKKAVIGIKDPVRPGVREAVQTCQAVGITVRMVTGDNISTAKVIAKECGIFTEGGLAIEGSQFRDLALHEMRAIIPKIQVMARSLPLDKHTLVSNLRKIGEVVAVTGDGTKDAPALHEADIGLAMGIAGTKVAKENADVIIMDNNFKTIVNVARWGLDAAISCGTVGSMCQLPIERGAVPPPCCAGVTKLNGMAQTTPDRQQACKCLQSAAKAIAGLKPSLASSLPGKCGVSIPYPISMNTNCNNVK
ncbi:hypothetical protein Bca4012_011381 [Brassica carinata]